MLYMHIYNMPFIMHSIAHHQALARQSSRKPRKVTIRSVSLRVPRVRCVRSMRFGTRLEVKRRTRAWKSTTHGQKDVERVLEVEQRAFRTNATQNGHTEKSRFDLAQTDRLRHAHYYCPLVVLIDV